MALRAYHFEWVAALDAAIGILGTPPNVASKAGLVFTTTGETAVSGSTDAKERIDRIMIDRIMNEAFEATKKNPGTNVPGDSDTKIPSWKIHDLRRTIANGCARFGVTPQTVEAILNHKRAQSVASPLYPIVMITPHEPSIAMPPATTKTRTAIG